MKVLAMFAPAVSPMSFLKAATLPTWIRMGLGMHVSEYFSLLCKRGSPNNVVMSNACREHIHTNVAKYIQGLRSEF